MSFFQTAEQDVKSFFSKVISDVETICQEGEAKLEPELQGLKQDYEKFLSAIKAKRLFIQGKTSTLLIAAGNDIAPSISIPEIQISPVIEPQP